MELSIFLHVYIFRIIISLFLFPNDNMSIKFHFGCNSFTIGAWWHFARYLMSLIFVLPKTGYVNEQRNSIQWKLKAFVEINDGISSRIPWIAMDIDAQLLCNSVSNFERNVALYEYSKYSMLDSRCLTIVYATSRIIDLPSGSYRLNDFNLTMNFNGKLQKLSTNMKSFNFAFVSNVFVYILTVFKYKFLSTVLINRDVVFF